MNYFFEGYGKGCISRSGMARPRNTNVFMILCFSCQIIFQMILFPHMYLVCPCHFVIYVWYLKICFSPICIISVCNCCRQNSKLLLKIPHTPSPVYLPEVIPEAANLMDFTPIITLYYMAQLTLRRRLSEWVWSYIVSYDHISPLKAQLSLAGSKRGSQKN